MTGVLDGGRHDLIVDGARVAYHVYGEGPIVVALPGGPGFSHAYLRAPLLEEKAKVVYVDPIGCGDSAELDDPSRYGRARDVADLEALRRHLGLERMALLGHSAGGFVAQQYAIGHPANVERLVLYDTSATNQADFDASLAAEMQARSDRPWFPAAAAALKTLMTSEIAEADLVAHAADVWPLYAYDHDADPSLAARLKEVARVGLARFQKAPRVAFDFREELAALRIPTLVIVGARDFVCAPALARSIHAAIPGSRLVTMERSGHMAHLEEAAAFAELVGAFLRD